MQRNNQGERCERLSSAQQHASECEGLSALRVFLDWCMCYMEVVTETDAMRCPKGMTGIK